MKQSNVLRAASLLALMMFVLLWLLAGCSSVPPTPFAAGQSIGTPAGCLEARERGHEC